MKITTAEIQKNDFSAMSFYGVMNYSIKQIRETVGVYKDLRKVNTSIFGFIHALSLLSEHSNSLDIPINLKEAEEWKEILTKYFDRIHKKVPEEIREYFRENLQKDLSTIVSKGKNYPDHIWKDQYWEREIIIKVKNDELKNKYTKLAEENEKYKNELGNALHNYLDDCLKNLDVNIEETNNKSVAPKQSIAFKPNYFKSKPCEFTYLLHDFEFFLDENQQENDVEINAYEIEKAIKEFLKTREPKLLSQLKFDCESSLFCVQTDDLKNLTKLNEALLLIAADDVIRKEYLKIGT